jgi:hypothetical protein
MFHNAGNEGSDTILPRCSIKDVLECTNMDNSYSSCTIFPTDNYIQKDLTYRKVSDFLECVVTSTISNIGEDHLKGLREYLDIDVSKRYIRFYFSPRKLILEGYTLQEIADKCFKNEECIVYPDFIGAIDVIIKDYYDLHLEHIASIKLNEYKDIKNVLIEDKKITTIKSSIEALIDQDYVDKSTIISNNILQVQEYFGIEAAAKVAKEIIDTEGSEVVIDFMTRSGKIIPLSKSNIHKYNKGFITDISFERARNTLSKYITEESNFSTYDTLTSTKAKIWSGRI